MEVSNEYVGRSLLGLPSTKQVIDLCNAKGWNCNGFTYSYKGNPIAYIKYNTVTMSEIRTQRYVHSALKQMNASGSGARVPEVYLAFKYQGEAYMVMEYVNGDTAHALLQGASAGTVTRIYNQVAEAFNQLVRVPVPSGQRPGPVGGGRIHHSFFKDHKASKIYDSVSDLQHHINKALERRKLTDRVNFSGEGLCLCYSDIHEGNFLITKTGQIYVIDFGKAVFLPRSFIGYVFYEGTESLTYAILPKVSVQESDNSKALCKVPRVL